MDEIVVMVYLPAWAIQYECRISEEMTVSKIEDLLKEVIQDDLEFDDRVLLSGTLFDKEDGKILQQEKTLLECGYQNGDELMFI